jgi:hypothetical protein
MTKEVKMFERYNVSNALHVWYCLEQAKDRSDPYGSDTAEIYVQHLLPIDFDASAGKALWIQASKNLRSILNMFCNSHCVDAFVNGRPIGEWMDEHQLLDRCEVRIAAKEIKNELQTDS